MKITFKEYILEYYKGRNATIGFRYSEPKLHSNIKLLAFSNYSFSEVETFFDEALHELLDKFFLEIELSNDRFLIENTLINIPQQISEKIIKNKMDLYIISINLTTYDEDEILSLLLELSKNNKFIMGPSALLNDKSFEISKKHRVKTKIGFKK
jgi:hypothetical protein